VNKRPGTFCKAMAIHGCALIAAAQAQTAWATDVAKGAVLKETPVPGLSQPQISACSEEIRRTRARWKYWPGEAGDAAARLGLFQKELFEGRCAGHPQAQAYVTGANRMLTHAKGRDNPISSSGDSQQPRPFKHSETK
jgi:hypothetical protein